ncbi:hypothetical protein [Amycolatopsis benzoatilytica]|uniref:hypothetical protein n=1 Tax=Amycolatopsis benzoatilytica TaxID=346045 RepID=UPI00036B7166|nr:hypothetical protein [Amycolatopsis benzoatilytica]
MSDYNWDATRAEVDYRMAELRRSARQARLSRGNRVVRWVRTHRTTQVEVPRQQRRTAAVPVGDQRTAAVPEARARQHA